MNWHKELPTEDLYNCLLVIKQGPAVKVVMGNYWSAVGKFAVYSDLIDIKDVYYYATLDDIIEDAGQFRKKDIQSKIK